MSSRKQPPRAGQAPPRSAGRRARRTLPGGLLLAGALVAGAVLPLSVGTPAHASGPNGGDVIANLFEWNWPSVARECTGVLGPKGYGAVQVAPPQDSIRIGGAPHAWWDVYQPVGYDLGSRMGTEAQFTSMVSTCHAAGVKVYSDVVLNHMAGADQASTDSYGGDTFSTSAKSYAQVPYSSSDFHQYPANCPNANMAINDWNSQTQVQECDLSNLEDLYTESAGVRAKEAAYLNKLIGYGVDGFRVDSAKHINQSDFADIESRLNNTQWGGRPYVLQEVFPGSGGNLAPAAFEGNGSVIGFDYADTLKSRFSSGISGLKGFGSSGLEPSAKEGAMVTNHDTERDGSTLNYKSGSQYTLATEFMLAWGYGTPSVYSGFAFSGRDDSPPADSAGYVTDTDCSSGAWVCTDRVRGVANMVGWHNAAGSAAVANWWDDGADAIAFSRGSAAWIALNNGTSPVTRTFTTGLAAGTYCDVVHGDISSSGTCGGPTVAVDSAGRATVTVNAGDSVALYATTAPCTTNCPPPPPSTVAETFNETRTTVYGENVYLVGSIPALGNWSPASAVPLSSAGYPVWSATVSLPANTSFEYKYIVKDAAGNVTWEPGGNHTATTGSTGGTLNDTWGSGGGGSGGTGQVTVTFDEYRTTVYGQNVYVTGSIPALGNWSTASAAALSSAAYPTWSTSLSVPAGTSFAYKYFIKDAAGNVTWESGANRTATTGASGTLTLDDTWK